MKAILVVDMPKSCADCTFRTSLNEDHLYCCATLPRINIDPMTVKHIKEHKCPLKPMESINNESEHISGFIEGWNMAIKELGLK